MKLKFKSKEVDQGNLSRVTEENQLQLQNTFT